VTNPSTKARPFTQSSGLTEGRRLPIDRPRPPLIARPIVTGRNEPVGRYNTGGCPLRLVWTAVVPNDPRTRSTSRPDHAWRVRKTELHVGDFLVSSYPAVSFFLGRTERCFLRKSDGAGERRGASGHPPLRTNRTRKRVIPPLPRRGRRGRRRSLRPSVAGTSPETVWGVFFFAGQVLDDFDEELGARAAGGRPGSRAWELELQAAQEKVAGLTSSPRQSQTVGRRCDGTRASVGPCPAVLLTGEGPARAAC